MRGFGTAGVYNLTVIDGHDAWNVTGTRRGFDGVLEPGILIIKRNDAFEDDKRKVQTWFVPFASLDRIALAIRCVPGEENAEG